MTNILTSISEKKSWRFRESLTKLAQIGICNYPSKIEWDLPNGPNTKLLELLDTKV